LECARNHYSGVGRICQVAQVIVHMIEPHDLGGEEREIKFQTMFRGGKMTPWTSGMAEFIKGPLLHEIVSKLERI